MKNVSILAIIFDSLSKQFYRSLSNINYGSIIGGGHMLEGKKVGFQGNRWLEVKVLLTGAYLCEILGKEKVNA